MFKLKLYPALTKNKLLTKMALFEVIGESFSI